MLVDRLPAVPLDDGGGADAQPRAGGLAVGAGRLGEPTAPDADATGEWLRGSAPGVVEWDGWQAIDEHERALGESQGRPRVKLVREHQLVAAGRGTPAAR